MSLSDPADTPLFAMRIHPHRSMTPGQFHLLLSCIGLVGIITSLPFVIMGAWPVAGFFGLDVLIVYLAFRSSFQSARAYEEVSVTPVELSLDKVTAKGLRTEWRFNPVWVRLERQSHEEFGLQRIDLVSRGRRVEIGGFLGPDAKARFAEGLGRALATARRGVFYS